MARLLAALVGLTLLATDAAGQTLSLPANVYRPGRYAPLRVQADAAGPVMIFNSGGLPIEWAAPGRSSVVVPLLLEGGRNPDFFVNRQPVAFAPAALGDTDADPPELAAFWNTVDPLPIGEDVDGHDAYAVAGLWQPGLPWPVRRWTLTATAVVVLVLGLARHAKPKHATRWLVVAAAGLSVGVVWLYPTDVARRVRPAERRAGWEWVWYAGGRSLTVFEPWSPGLRYVAERSDDVVRRGPVLKCDAGGRPIGISVDLSPRGRAVFIRPRVSPPPASAE